MKHVIVVPVDGSPVSERALPLASAVARDLGLQMRLVCACEAEPSTEPTTGGESPAQAAWWRVRRDYGLEPVVAVRSGPAAPVILEEAAAPDVWALAMASHSREGLQRTVLGSVTERVVEEAPVPVLVVPAAVAAPGLPRLRRILAPLDGSQQAELILPAVNRFATLLGAEVMVLRVFQPAGQEGGHGSLAGVGQVVNGVTSRELASVHRYERRQPRTVETVELGEPARVIAEVCDRERIDLVAFATHGRSPLDAERLSVVAETVLRHSRVPLMAFGRELLRLLSARRIETAGSGQVSSLLTDGDGAAAG